MMNNTGKWWREFVPSVRFRKTVNRMGTASALALAALLVAAMTRDVLGQDGQQGQSGQHGKAYHFTPIALLGEAAPGGDSFTSDFEPSGLNNHGEVAFVADLTIGGEGVFVGRRERLSQIVRFGQPAPGGGVFGPGELGRLGLNEGGDVAFAFSLQPFNQPLNCGVYRFSHNDQKLTAVVVPGVTPAPGGGRFAGAFFNSSINNSGDVVFSGVVEGAPYKPPGFNGFATGLFQAGKHGGIVSVVKPGDPAPGGGRFDVAINGWINDRGDISFGGHVAGEDCIDIFPGFACGESVYLKSAATGAVQSIAHQDQLAPGGGFFRLAFGPVVNNRGDIVFIGDLTPRPGSLEKFGVFLFSKGVIMPVARPGDSLPGGGKLVSAGGQDATYHLNNQGDVSFTGTLNTDVDSDGILDTGVYVFSKDSRRLVARTGTSIPGLGTIAYLGLAPFCAVPCAPAGGIINEHGEVLFFATLKDGRGVLLLATP